MKLNAGLSQKMIPRLELAGAGLVAGFISSLAISALLLLAERVADLPVGTFYLVLASALLQSQGHGVNTIAIGLLMHLAAGCILGLAISAPFSAVPRWFKSAAKYAPAYGLVAGFVLWLALFIPITYWVMLPLLNSVEDRVISQQVPTGEVSEIATGDLLAIMDRLILGSLAFNMFFGLLVVILFRSISEAYMRNKKLVL
jgi:hypothetical protein